MVACLLALYDRLDCLPAEVLYVTDVRSNHLAVVIAVCILQGSDERRMTQSSWEASRRACDGVILSRREVVLLDLMLEDDAKLRDEGLHPLVELLGIRFKWEIPEFSHAHTQVDVVHQKIELN